MNEHWFKPKRYGLGAAPSSWEGWTLVVAYLAGVALAGYFTGLPTERTGEQPFTFVIITLALTAVFVIVAWRKTEGGWRWRWGDKD